MKILNCLFVIVLSLSVFGCGEWKKINDKIEAEAKLQENAQQPINSMYLRTGKIEKYKYEGHTYLVWDGFKAGSMIHDPNCECHENN